MARKTQKKQKKDQDGSTLEVKRRRRNLARDSPFQRSSSFRGVTRHRLSGRYEAHLWDKNCWNKTQNRKGRQVYLGAYEEEEAAARAYDLAALKYWGKDTLLNFAASEYHKELQEMECQSREEYIGSLRRKSSGFSRGVSKYRGVARHHHNGRWEARIGKVFGNKYLYLGTYATQEEAATAYDKAAVQYRGVHAVTNFDLSRYLNPSSDIQVHPSLNSSLESGNDDVSKSEEDLTETLRDPLRFTGNSKPDYHDDVDSTCDRTKACRSSPTSTCIRRLSPQSCSDLKVDLSFISGDDTLTKEIDTITIELQERVENSWKTVESPASYDQLHLIDRSFCERKWIYSERQDSKDYLDVMDPVFDDLDSFESPIFKNAFECVK